MVGFKLYDLTHDFCVVQAEREGKVNEWHATLLKRYTSLARKNGEEESEGSDVRE